MNISERASELRRLRAEATKGEWKRYGPSKPGWDGLAHMWHSGNDFGVGSPDQIIAQVFRRGARGEEPAEANAALIVAAANSVDELARFCEEAWAEIRNAVDWCERDQAEPMVAIAALKRLLARYSSEPAPKP